MNREWNSHNLACAIFHWYTHYVYHDTCRETAHLPYHNIINSVYPWECSTSSANRQLPGRCWTMVTSRKKAACFGRHPLSLTVVQECDRHFHFWSSIEFASKRIYDMSFLTVRNVSVQCCQFIITSSTLLDYIVISSKKNKLHEWSQVKRGEKHHEKWMQIAAASRPSFFVRPLGTDFRHILSAPVCINTAVCRVLNAVGGTGRLFMLVNTHAEQGGVWGWAENNESEDKLKPRSKSHPENRKRPSLSQGGGAA